MKNMKILFLLGQITMGQGVNEYFNSNLGISKRKEENVVMTVGQEEFTLKAELKLPLFKNVGQCNTNAPTSYIDTSAEEEARVNARVVKRNKLLVKLLRERYTGNDNIKSSYLSLNRNKRSIGQYWKDFGILTGYYTDDKVNTEKELREERDSELEDKINNIGENIHTSLVIMQQNQIELSTHICEWDEYLNMELLNVHADQVVNSVDQVMYE